MTHVSRLRSIAPLLAAAVIAAGCRTRAAPERLVVAFEPQPALGLLFLARDGGCAAHAGLEIEARPTASGREALGLLLSGEADAAVAYETPVVLRASAAPDLRLLTTLHVSSRNTVAIGRRDRGVQRADDLRGRTVAVPLRTNAEFLLEMLLAANGISRDDVNVVDVAPDQAPAVLAAGRVDAIAISSPYADLAAQALPEGTAVELRSGIYTETSLLATRASTLAARRPALAKLVRCLAAEEDRATTEPARTARIVAAAVPGIPPDLVAAALARVTFQVGLSSALVTQLDQEAEWLRAAGALAGRPVDYRRLLAPALVAAAAPESVTIPLGP